MTAPLPDLTGWLVGVLQAALPEADVSQRRTPTTTNRSGQFVRVQTLGGRTTWGGLMWHPLVALEAWASDHDAAHDLGAAAHAALCALEGAVTPGVLHLCEVDVMTACADTPIDGHPVVTTTAALTVELPAT